MNTGGMRVMATPYIFIWTEKKPQAIFYLTDIFVGTHKKEVDMENLEKKSEKILCKT